jgi:hypothetical protein
MKLTFRRVRTIVLAALLIFAVSFAGTDYFLRGHFYYAKRAANFLARYTWQAVFPPSGPVRLYIRAEADQDYRALHSDWKTRLAALLDAAAGRFVEAFDIRFTVLGIGAWERPSRLADYAGLLAYAERKIDRRGAQIVVLMTGQDEGAAEPDRWLDVGAAHYLGNCVIVGDEALLLHELGHLFGAVDYPPGRPGYEDETIYSYKFAGRTERLDAPNRARILDHKYRLLW